jgi:hypothetical protein
MVLKSHKVEIEKAIQAVNLKTTDFEIEEKDNILTLIPKGSTIFFKFVHATNNYHIFGAISKRFTPNHEVMENPKANFGIHDLIERLFVPWLNNHVKVFLEDYNTPDPWANLHVEYNSITFNSEHQLHSKEKFTPSEIRSIEPALDGLEKKIEALKVETEVQNELKQIKEDFREIREDLKTLTKKKWSWQFIGLGFQILTFAQEFAPEAFEELKDTINGLFSEFSKRLIS